MRLRARFPQLKIVVGRWGLKSSVENDREQLQSAGADYVAFSMSETRSQILSLLAIVATQQLPPKQRSETDVERVKQPA